MDKKIYVVTHCGSVKKIFEDEQEMKEYYKKECEFESQFSEKIYPDYYETTRAEFICENICGKYKETIRHNAEFMSKNTGDDVNKCYTYIYFDQHCSKCPLVERSPYKEAQK